MTKNINFENNINDENKDSCLKSHIGQILEEYIRDIRSKSRKKKNETASVSDYNRRFNKDFSSVLGCVNRDVAKDVCHRASVKESYGIENVVPAVLSINVNKKSYDDIGDVIFSSFFYANGIDVKGLKVNEYMKDRGINSYKVKDPNLKDYFYENLIIDTIRKYKKRFFEYDKLGNYEKKDKSGYIHDTNSMTNLLGFIMLKNFKSDGIKGYIGLAKTFDEICLLKVLDDIFEDAKTSIRKKITIDTVISADERDSNKDLINRMKRNYISNQANVAYGALKNS